MFRVALALVLSLAPDICALPKRLLNELSVARTDSELESALAKLKEHFRLRKLCDYELKLRRLPLHCYGLDEIAESELDRRCLAQTQAQNVEKILGSGLARLSLSCREHLLQLWQIEKYKNQTN